MSPALRWVVASLLLPWECGARDAVQMQSSAPAVEEGTVKEFRSFLRASGKVYPDTRTFVDRLNTYARNVAFIEAFNSNSTSSGFSLGINGFADLTASEFRQTHLLSRPNRDVRVGTLATSVNVSPWSSSGGIVPDRVDWREKGAVTPVKDQKTCGACWAFSAAGAIESAWFLATGALVSLSEEELVDCSGGKDRGCSGGDPSTAFDWVVEHGICSEKEYPYTAYQDECHNQFNPCEAVVRIAGHAAVMPDNELQLKEAVSQQPVSVEVEADTDEFRFYKTGVFQSAGCGTLLDHAVLVVGYGSQDGHDYWLVKNSWGAGWGEQGYIRLARTESTATYGECGIAMRPSFPFVRREHVFV